MILAVVLRRPLDTVFFWVWALMISWSRLLVPVCEVALTIYLSISLSTDGSSNLVDIGHASSPRSIAMHRFGRTKIYPGILLALKPPITSPVGVSVVLFILLL